METQKLITRTMEEIIGSNSYISSQRGNEIAIDNNSCDLNDTIESVIKKMNLPQDRVFIMDTEHTDEEHMEYMHNIIRYNDSLIGVKCKIVLQDLEENLLPERDKDTLNLVVKTYTGKFRQTPGGAILLNTIDDMNLRIQLKVLLTMKGQKIIPEDENWNIILHVYILTPADKPMYQDLYHCLSTILSRIPLFTEYLGNTLELANYFIGLQNIEGSVGNSEAQGMIERLVTLQMLQSMQNDTGYFNDWT